jgi:hypothetical protein
MSERKFCNPYHTRHHHHHTPTRFATVLFRVGRLTAICSSGRGFLFWGGKKKLPLAHRCLSFFVVVVTRQFVCSLVYSHCCIRRSSPPVLLCCTS